MKRVMVYLMILGLLASAGLACGGSSPTSAPTADTQATVNAAIAATKAAESSFQAAVSTSVAATVTAMPPLPTPIPTQAYETLSEEELEAMIDEAVNEAVAASNQASTSATNATADGTITEDELTDLYAYYYYADDAIALAEELIGIYDELYGELATETIDLLLAVEQELEAASQNAEGIYDLLDDLAAALEQGQALSSEQINQLKTYAQAAQTKMTQAQTETGTWVKAVQAEIQTRVNQALTVLPQSIATDRKGAIQSALEYVASVKQAYADKIITQAELTSIAQLGANAVASLSAQGEQLQQLAGQLNSLTALIAGGQLPSIQSTLSSLEAILGAIPAIP